MTVHHFFNSLGEWIAFQYGMFFFTPEGDWFAWKPWDDQDDLVDTNGEYIGSVWRGNRLYRFTNRVPRVVSAFPGFPSFPPYPGYPGYAGYEPLPPFAEDVEIRVGR